MAIAAASLGGAGMLIGLGLVAPRVLRRKGEEENELEA
jgi:hypothetical protein